MEKQQKEEYYNSVINELNAILDAESDFILIMSTINAVLKAKFDHFYWVGFYCVQNQSLIVGPYQGTMGCLHIPFEKGICGRAAREGLSQIVEDVHADPEHIACDSKTNSEIVVPVYNNFNQLIAVLDVDSTQIAAFCETDRHYLESILNRHFKEKALTYNLNFS